MEKIVIILISDSVRSNNKNFLGHFLHGLKLKSYEFNKYKTKKEKQRLISINVLGKNVPSNAEKLKFRALEEGTFFCKRFSF